jgi:hypothetical protein
MQLVRGGLNIQPMRSKHGVRRYRRVGPYLRWMCGTVQYSTVLYCTEGGERSSFGWRGCSIEFKIAGATVL